MGIVTHRLYLGSVPRISFFNGHLSRAAESVDCSSLYLCAIKLDLFFEKYPRLLERMRLHATIARRSPSIIRARAGSEKKAGSREEKESREKESNAEGRRSDMFVERTTGCDSRRISDSKVRGMAASDATAYACSTVPPNFSGRFATQIPHAPPSALVVRLRQRAMQRALAAG